MEDRVRQVRSPVVPDLVSSFFGSGPEADHMSYIALEGRWTSDVNPDYLTHKTFHVMEGERGGTRMPGAARIGAHDDLMLSVAITLWMATSGPVTIVEPFPLI